MNNHFPDNQDHDVLFSRRKMLSLLGVAGASTMSATVVANPKSVQKNTGKNTCFFYDSVVDMKQDRSLKEGDLM